MKKIRLILSFTIFCGYLAAQNDIKFSKLYNVIPGMPCYSDRISVCSNGYMIYGGTIDSNNLAKVVMLKIDTLGNILWKKSYGKRGYDYFDESIITAGGGGIAVPWGGYIEPGTVINNPESWEKLALYRFDDNGDTLWTKIYNDSTNEIGIVSKVTREKQFIVGGEWVLYDSVNNEYKLFTTTLKKTDSLGNKIWQKTYHAFPSHTRESLSLDTCKDGGYIICAVDLDTSYLCGYNIFIMKTDSAGISEWTQYINDPICSVYPSYILSLRDGSYIVCGSYVESIRLGGDQQFVELYLVKISSVGNVQWAKQYNTGGSWDASRLFSLKELSNGDIVTSGADSSSFLGCILKVDSNGNQKLLRYYKMESPSEQDCLYDIQLTPDGGFVATGQTYGSTQNIWVVKTDSLGCDTLDCLFTGVNEVKENEAGVNVYPNPNIGSFTLELTNINENYKVEIYNMLGEKVYQSTTNSDNIQINLSGQSQGIYLYRVISENGNLLGEGKVIIQK